MKTWNAAVPGDNYSKKGGENTQIITMEVSKDCEILRFLSKFVWLRIIVANIVTWTVGFIHSKSGFHIVLNTNSVMTVACHNSCDLSTLTPSLPELLSECFTGRNVAIFTVLHWNDSRCEWNQMSKTFISLLFKGERIHNQESTILLNRTAPNNITIDRKI